MIESHAQIIPLLALRDMQTGAKFLRDVLGFSVLSQNDTLIELVLNDQRIDIVVEIEPIGRFTPHHLALAVNNVETSLAQVISRGATLNDEMTPNGTREIKEFWDAGIRYAFINGPEGAMIELCEKIGVQVQELSHDHIGILCTDMETELSKLADFAPENIARYQLRDAAGITDVRFERYGRSVCELFEPPRTAANIIPDAWRGCRFI